MQSLTIFKKIKWGYTNPKLWGSITMQVISHNFFEYCIRQEIIFPHLIKLVLLKTFGNPSSKTFPVGNRSKTFLTGTTVYTQQMSKIRTRLVVKPKIIQSLSTCQNHSINLLDSLNPHMSDTPDFRIP